MLFYQIYSIFVSMSFPTFAACKFLERARNVASAAYWGVMFAPRSVAIGWQRGRA
jgi:hypothetical protein